MSFQSFSVVFSDLLEIIAYVHILLLILVRVTRTEAFLSTH